MHINPDSINKAPIDKMSDVVALLDSADSTDVDVGMTDSDNTIQSPFRTYSVREHLSPEMRGVIKQLFADCQHMYRFLEEVQGSLLEAYRFRLLDQTDYHTHLEKLGTARDGILDLNLMIDQYIQQVPGKTPVEFQAELDASVPEIYSTLQEVAKDCGFKSIKGGLYSILGADYKQKLSEAALESINLYDRVIRPTGYKIYDVESVGTDSVILTHPDGWRLEQDDARMLKGMPHPMEIATWDNPSAHEKMHGAELLIPLHNDNGQLERVVSLKGNFANDPLNIKYTVGELNSRKEAYIAEAATTQVPAKFRSSFLEQYSVRDFLMKSPQDYRKDLEHSYVDAIQLKNMKYPELAKEFKKAPLERQVEMLSLMVIQGDADLCITLYDWFLAKHPDYRSILRNCLHYTVQRTLDLKSQDLEAMRKRLENASASDLDMKGYVLQSKAPEDAKAKALERIKESKGGDSSKADKWLTGWKNIPWGRTAEEPISMADGTDAVRAHLDHVKATLDKAIYGQEEAKDELMEICGQAVATGGWNGACIGLQGPPGNGKTTLAREGIAKAFDRPFAMIDLGGAQDSSTLIGHGYTYVGSEWGRIVDVLMQTKCMNPVFYFDELDKVSKTEKGREIIGVLTALTDPAQNMDFHDKYFSGISFNLKDALFIFSYNDESAVDPILKDRISQIRTKPLNRCEKQIIAQDYLLPEICRLTGFKRSEIDVTNDEIRHIIDGYTHEAGVRGLKRALSKIVRRLNLDRLYHPEKFNGPIKIDRKTIVRCLKEARIEVEQIAPKPHIGVVNGLSVYAASMTGCLQPIQVAKTLANQHLHLELTGQQQEVMQESMSNARTVAWALIPQELKSKIRSEDPFGLAIHCPDAATPKDGPSAGGAITTAIISELTGVAVRNDVAMTGEIDIRGNIRAIGGLRAKIEGAKKAGAKLVLCPKDNEKDLIRTKERQPELFTDGFDAIAVEHISEVLEHALVPNDLKWEDFH